MSFCVITDAFRRAAASNLWLLFIAAFTLLAGCEEKKPVEKPQRETDVSAADLKVPENVPPPVETQPYDEGFAAGTNAGELAGKVRTARTQPKSPTADELDVLALEAAGANPDRGPKWQRGFVSGYRDGFGRTAKGIR